MHRVPAAVRAAATLLCAVLLVLVSGCGANDPATPPAATSGSTAIPDPTADDEGGNPTCVAVFNLLEQLRPVADQYTVAVGPDATKAAAAKTDVQTKMRQLAADIRKAAGTAAEQKVRDAAENAAKGFETGAADPQFFAPKDEQAAGDAFNEATLRWTSELLATC